MISKSEISKSAKPASAAAESGGDAMEGGSAYVQSLYEIAKLTTELGEEEEIEYWHELEAGFIGRQSL